MTTTIKITELTNIGSNLASSTVIPVVNMAGTPTTEKTVLGNIANVVLAGAGGNYVAAAKATTATTANTVLTNAQPNITSVGTLTNVVVSGNASVNGNITSNGTAYVGNLSTTGLASITTLNVGTTANLGAVANVIIIGGTSGQKLTTDGAGNLSWTNDANSSYGNSNVTSLLGAFGSNTITTTGNVSVGNIIGNGQALTNIAGANVSGFVPNANVANTAFAVAGANVSGFVPNANVANTAFAVSAANVSGLGNIATLNLDGNVGNLLTGNGTYVAIPTVPTVGNIATLNLNGNSQTWLAGNGVFANIAIPSVGNIATLNLDGNASNVLRGDGTFGADANSSYGNSNVTSLVGAFGSNTITTTGNVSVGNIIGNGQALTGLTGANVSGFVPNANVANTAFAVAGANVSGFVPNANVANTAFAVAAANVSGLGNIATINLTGSNSNVLYGNGVFAAVTGGNANTGNVTFDDVTVQGVNGLNLSAGADFTANLAFLQVRAGDVASHIHLDTGNNEAYDLIVGDDQNYVQVSSTGNILLSAYDSNTSQYTWTLDYNGNLILAGGNSVIQSIANSSLDPTLPNVSTMVLTPDANYNSQVLVLDPTAVGHIHLRAYASSNIDEPSANIFLGGEQTAFEITQGANNQAVIHSNGKSWTFGNDGNISSDTLTFTTTLANYRTTEYQTAGVWDVYVEDNSSGPYNGYAWIDVTFKDNQINKPQVYIENQAANTGIPYRWTFDENGTLELPNGADIRDNAGNAVAFGAGAGANTQGANAVAIGNGAGNDTQGTYAIAIGNGAGNDTQGEGALAIGYAAGNITQGEFAVAFGLSAGADTQGQGAVAIGALAGQTSQGQGAVAVGINAGETTQGSAAVAVGVYAGRTSQGEDAVAVGRNAGNDTQGEAAVAIGFDAGNDTQGTQAIAIGQNAGKDTQGNFAVAVGINAGITTQGENAVAIGNGAAQTLQGANAVAIGAGAGSNNQAANSIVINATGSALENTTANSLVMAPIRNDVANVAEILFYNTTSKEITYGNTISVAGNITGGNLTTAGNISGNTNGFTIGYLNIPQVSAANATLALTDAGKHYYSTTAGNLTLTIPTNASVAFNTGTAVSIVVQAAGNILVNAAAGVTLYMAGNSTAANRVVGGYGMATVMKVGTDTWFINGTGVT